MCQQLIKFSLIRSMRSFDLSVELWRSRFNIYVKLGLKLMASVGSDRMDAEREFVNHIINELNSILHISLTSFCSLQNNIKCSGGSDIPTREREGVHV